MKLAKEFFDTLRATKMLGEKLEQSEVDGLNRVLEACEKASFPISWTAYCLATAFHETAGTMQPIAEYGGNAYKTRLYDVTGIKPERAKRHGNTAPGDGVKYAGRGYVQLTWKNNYKRAGEALGIDLVESPGLALQPDIAAMIMTRGMKEGWFTGRDLDDYLPMHGPAGDTEFQRARKIINGTDRAEDIAEYALRFQDALKAGEW